MKTLQNFFLVAAYLVGLSAGGVLQAKNTGATIEDAKKQVVPSVPLPKRADKDIFRDLSGCQKAGITAGAASKTRLAECISSAAQKLAVKAELDSTSGIQVLKVPSGTAYQEFADSLALHNNKLFGIRVRLQVAGDVPVPGTGNGTAAGQDSNKWNLADLYPSDEAWAADKAKIDERIKKLGALKGKLALSAGDMYNTVDTIMKLDQDLEKMCAYAKMRSDADKRVAQTQQMSQSADNIKAGFIAAVSFLDTEILAMDRSKLQMFVSADTKLRQYAPYFNEVLRTAPHILSAQEETILAKTALIAGSGDSISSILRDAEMPKPAVKVLEGNKLKTVHLDYPVFSLYRTSQDPATRTRVFDAYIGQMKKFQGTVGAALSSQVSAHVMEKDVRKYGSCLEAALSASNVPVAVYKRLISDVNANLPTLHRYLKLRKQMMGISQLGYQDLYAPLFKEVVRKYTPEQAKEIVLKAVAPLGAKYQAAIQKSYDERWLDLMPAPGKDSGAYSAGIYGVHPYQMQNFNGTREEVSTLAHESGHSMHSWMSANKQPYVTADPEIFVAEVASTLNENLLNRYLVSQTKNKAEKISLLGARLENLRTTLFRQTLFAEFELTVHEMAEKGEPLVGEKLSELYLGLLKKYYGDAQGICKVKDLYGSEWVLVPHFFWNFYVYSYATSITASSFLTDKIITEQSSGKTIAKDAYLNFLAAGSSKPPVELLKDAGVDVTSPATFKAAMKEMNDIMDQIEALKN